MTRPSPPGGVPPVTVRRDARRLLDALYAGSSRGHEQHRINHARGVLVHGSFTASPGARGISAAAHLHGGTVSVLLRFSNSGAVPWTPDDGDHADPRGLAVRFATASGASTDLVGHSTDRFPARTPDEFADFLAALPDPTALQRYLDGHPRARLFLDGLSPRPTSYLALTYHMLHTYVLTSHRGHRTVGRLRVEPFAPATSAVIGGSAPSGGDYLHDELRARLASGSVAMRLLLQVADQDDATDDISSPWPDDRRTLHLGTLHLHSVDGDQAQQQFEVFDPARLLPGMASAGDPMLGVRSAAYASSYLRRSAG